MASTSFIGSPDGPVLMALLRGKAALVVSHALGEVARVCDRLAVLVEGRLAYLGSLAALLPDPETGQARSLEEALAPLYSS